MLRRLLRLKEKIEAVHYVVNKLQVQPQCSLTGRTFDLLEFIEEITKDKATTDLSIEELDTATDFFLREHKNFTRIQTERIFKNIPILGVLYLIWSKYGVLNPDLTTYLLAFYFAQDKSEAEFFASEFCKLYLDNSINILLAPKKRFTSMIGDSDEQTIVLKIVNEDCGWEITSPRGINQIVSNISDKYIGAI